MTKIVKILILIEKINNALNDLENSIIINDRNIFYKKYKTTIQLLDTM